MTVALAVLGFVVVAVLIGPWLWPHDPAFIDARARNAGPGLAHPLGTDALGRDMWARLLFGARTSLTVGLAVVALSALVGTLLGALAGYFGGWIDEVIMRITDIFLAFPFLVTLLVARSFLSSVPWLEPVIGNITSIRFVIVLSAGPASTPKLSRQLSRAPTRRRAWTRATSRRSSRSSPSAPPASRRSVCG